MASLQPLLSGGEPITVRSHSGHFIVRGLPLGVTFTRSPTSNVEYLRLDPTLTAVSLERIRQAVFTELGLPDKVLGLVTVTTRPVIGDDAPVRIASVHYADAWGYRVELPERIEKERFFEVAVEVVLMEVANRSAGVREAEVPPWLGKGLAADLLATSLLTMALEPDSEIAQREHSPDALRASRELIRQRPPLKFDELCQPGPEQLNGEDAALYRACAHLFVHDLLRLPGGRDALRNMLSSLPQHLNWQTTFLWSFRDRFPRLIDVDKWYALSAMNLIGRDPMSVWPMSATCRQLEETLMTSVQVRLEARELPIQTSASLQRILSEWEVARQQPVLNQVISRLSALRLRAAAGTLEVVDGYLRVLQAYHASAREVKGPGGNRVPPKAILHQLDELDRKRHALCEGPPTAEAAR